MQGSITFDELKAMENDFLADRSNRIAMNAVVNNGLLISAKNAEVYRTTTHNYSVNIKQGEITNQKASGRCWMFAALNTMRFQVMQKQLMIVHHLYYIHQLYFQNKKSYH